MKFNKYKDCSRLWPAYPPGGVDGLLCAGGLPKNGHTLNDFVIIKEIQI